MGRGARLRGEGGGEGSEVEGERGVGRGVRLRGEGGVKGSEVEGREVWEGE